MTAQQKFDSKYRSQRFSELVGQPVAAQYLSRLVMAGKPRNILAQGPTGCGKTSAARIYGRALNCLGIQPGGEPCNDCAHCRMQLADRFPDYQEQDTGTQGGKDAIVGFLEAARTPPIAGRHLVRVIDEAQALTSASHEAVKRILEEPPPHLVVVLTTTDSSRILKDVRDRCSPVTFKRIRQADAVAHLEAICAKENLACERPALELIAFLAEGHLRPLVGALDQLADFGDITFSNARQILNLGCIEHLPRLWAALLSGDLPAALDTLRAWDDEPDRIVNLWREFLLWLQCRFVHRAEATVNPLFSALPQRDVRGIVDVLAARAQAAGIELEDALASLSRVLGLAQIHNPLLLQLMVRDLHNLLHRQGLDAARMGAAVPPDRKPAAPGPAPRRERQLAAAYVANRNGVARPASMAEDAPAFFPVARAAPPPVAPPVPMMPMGGMPFMQPPPAPAPHAVVSVAPPPAPLHPPVAADGGAADGHIRVPAGATGGELQVKVQLPPPRRPFYAHDVQMAGWKEADGEVKALFPADDLSG